MFRKLRRSFFLPGKVRTYCAYAIGEIVLIMIGIFLALQLNNWNEERKERIEERTILIRIVEELKVNLALAKNMKDHNFQKRDALLSLSGKYSGAPIKDKRALLEEVLISTHHSWRGQNMGTSTYTELINSGKIGLIEDLVLRNAIHRYYLRKTEYQERGAARITGYGRRLFDLVPISEEEGGLTLEPSLSQAEVDTLVEELLSSDLNTYLPAEINRSKFNIYTYRIIGEETQELIEAIEAELDEN